MKIVVRLLLVILFVELLICGRIAARRMFRHVPVLPTASWDDPVLQRDMEALAAQAESGSSDDWQALGDALLGQGFYVEAELAFRNAVALDPTNHAAQFGLALCLDRTGRVDESTAAYLQAAALPAPPEEAISTARHARYAIGKNHLRNEDVDAAEAAFRENSGFGPSDYQLAKLLVRSDHVEDALPIIERNLERAPHSLWFNFIQYRAMRSLNRPADAADAADRLQRSSYVVPLNFNTDYVEPLSKRYGINKLNEEYNRLLSGGDMNALAEQLEKTLQVIGDRTLPQRNSSLMRLIEVEFQRGNTEHMLSLLQQLKDLGEMNADMLQLEGAALTILGQPDAGAALWLRAAKMSPNIPLHHFLAQYYEQQGDEATRDLHLGQQALLTAKLQYWSNQFPEARQAAIQATELIPQDAQAWFYLGEVERQLGQVDDAVAAYQECLTRNPYHGRATERLTRLQAEKKSSRDRQ